MVSCEYCEKMEGRGGSRHHVPVQIPFWCEDELAGAEFEVLPGIYGIPSRLEFRGRVLGEWVSANAEIRYCPMCGRKLPEGSEGSA